MRAPVTHRRTLTAVAVSAIVAFAAIWSAALFLTAQDQRDVLRDAETELLGAQNAISAQVERTVENGRFLLTAVDLWLGDTAGAPGRTLNDLATWIAALERSQEIPLTIHLFDPAGNIIRYGGSKLHGVSIVDRDYYQALASSTLTLYAGTQVTGRDSGRNVIPLAAKVPANAYGVGFAVASIPIQTLADAFEGLLVTAPGIVGAVRDDGTILFRTPDHEKMTGRKVDLSQIFNTASDAPRIGLITHHLRGDGQRMMTAYAKLANLPLYVYGSFLISDLSAKTNDRAWPKILTAIIATIVVLIGASLLGFLILQREKEARKVADALVAADEANAAKTQFLANVSHELRTPLNAVIGFSEALSAQIFGPLSERYRGYSDDILTSGRHLLSVVDQLLDMASIEARRERLKREPIAIDAVADDIAQMMRPIADRRNISVIVRKRGSPIVIESDSRCVRQILINLTSNAVRFCKQGGEVGLSWTREENGDVQVIVEDQGPGIAEEDLARIFDLFWQGDDAYVRRHGGVGLGLPLTRTLVTALGGTIRVESQPGVGSRFTVRLPSVMPAA